LFAWLSFWSYKDIKMEHFGMKDEPALILGYRPLIYRLV
jgi:hypothetical protein